MSELEVSSNAYKQLIRSDGGKRLEAWIKETANEKRKNASKSQDTAYGELKFADGIEYVLSHIKTMSKAG